MNRVVLAALCFLLIATQDIGAQPVPVGDEFQVNSYTTQYQRASAVAVQPDGGFIVVWFSFDGKGVKAQRFDSAGQALGTEFRVESHTTGYQVTPTIEADAAGHFIVAWNSGSTGHNNGADGSLLAVAAQRYASDGTPIAAEFVANQYTTGSQQSPSVAFSANGDFVIVWSSEGSTSSDTGTYSIQAQRFASNGSRINAEFQINSYTTGNQTAPDLAFGPNGDFLVTWMSAGSAGTDQEPESIQARFFASDGSPQNSEIQINSFTTGAQRSPRVASTPTGEFVVAWDGGSGSGAGADGDHSGISARRLASNGSFLGDEFVVNTFTSDSQRFPEILTEEDGDFFIVWQSFDNRPTDINIGGQFFDSSGSPIGSELRINSYTSGFQSNASISGDSNGRFVVTWESFGSTGSDNDERSVQARRLELAGTVGDRVFFDLDFDGIQDPGEPGIAGTTVHLYREDGTAVASTETDSQGEYRFVVEEGRYYLSFDLPGTYSFTLQDRGDDALDSDVDPTSGYTAVFEVLAGDDLSRDAGMSNGIGDFVWLDEDHDGFQDGGEPGMANVSVALLTASGLEVASTTTNASGFYRFSNPAPDDYYLEMTPPMGYCFTAAHQGEDDASDSDVDVATGRSPVFRFLLGQIDQSRDAGLVPEASLGDRVWHDLDGNGLQDGGEPGVEAVVVNLYDPFGSLLQTTLTDAQGRYAFSSGPGDYYLGFTAPAGFEFTLRDQGANDDADSDVNPASGTTIVLTLAEGEADTAWDAGLRLESALANLGNRVWLDASGDGLQTGGEDGFASVDVHLFDLSDTLLDSTTTDSAGYFAFSVGTGEYYLQFVLPDGFRFTSPDVGGNDAVDSDADPTLGTTVAIAIAAGQSDTSWDAGLIPEPPLGSLGDRVWMDTNGDGLQTGGEDGMPGVDVHLFDLTNALLQTTSTDSNGWYSFAVDPGRYYLEFVEPDGFLFTSKDEGADDSVDSDADPESGLTVVIAVADGQTATRWDAGLVAEPPPGTIGDRLWRDADRNGIQDGGETGFASVEVRLFDASTFAQLQNTFTDNSGHYEFQAEPGDYYLSFVAPPGFEFTQRDQGADDTVDSDVNPQSATTIPFALLEGQSVSHWDAGLVPTVSTGNLGDRVWLDLDGDGLQDGGENGVAEVEVRLFDSVGALLQTTTTDTMGLFDFEAEPGTFYLEFVAPNGFSFSPQNQGTSDAVDSDVDPALGTTLLFTLGAGAIDMSRDAGIEPSTIGDLVWHDRDGDGIQDAGESGISGARVDLLDEFGTTLSTAFSDSDGRFGFGNINSATYQLAFTLPPGYVFTLRDQGIDDTTDSDADPATGLTPPIIYTEGTSRRFFDAGLIPDVLFANGFESGDATAWSAEMP